MRALKLMLSLFMSVLFMPAASALAVETSDSEDPIRLAPTPVCSPDGRPANFTPEDREEPQRAWWVSVAGVAEAGVYYDFVYDTRVEAQGPWGWVVWVGLLGDPRDNSPFLAATADKNYAEGSCYFVIDEFS